MLSTMQDFPLTISHILRHGQTVHGRSRVETYNGAGVRTATFSGVTARSEQLARALGRLGVGPGDRVATFGWNT